MPNNIELAKIYQTELDKALVSQAVTGFMELNSDQIKYQGGNEIKIPKMSMDGLADYSRTTGYAKGSIDFSYETRSMTQDRGRALSIDAMDVEETNFAAEASMRLGEYQRVNVVPEVDAYRVSKLAAIAVAGDRARYGYAPVVGTILSELKADIAEIQDNIGDGVELIVMMSRPCLAVLEQADGITRFLQADVIRKGDVETRVKSLDGIPIVAVPSGIMKTAMEFADGTTAGQESGGYSAAAAAKNVNWMVFPKRAPIAVSKTDKMKIFTPDQNQDADAYKLTYRKYHDLFVLDNMIPAMKACIKEAEV